MAKLLSEKYIVIVTKSIGYFDRVLACDYQTIIDYVKKLSFDHQIIIWFYPTDELNRWGALTNESSAVKSVTMNNEKSLSEFKSEVEKLTEQLAIKIEGIGENE